MKLASKKLLLSLSFGGSLIAGVAQADVISFRDINTIRPREDGTVTITLIGFNSRRCTSSGANGIALPAGEGGQNMLKVALAAKLSGKRIRADLYPNGSVCDGPYPVARWIDIEAD